MSIIEGNGIKLQDQTATIYIFYFMTINWFYNHLSNKGALLMFIITILMCIIIYWEKPLLKERREEKQLLFWSKKHVYHNNCQCLLHRDTKASQQADVTSYSIHI
jgi:hypothetical protein